MKNFKFYLVAGLMTISTSAFAQFANTGNNSGGNSTVDTENYSRIEVSYNPTMVSYDKDWGMNNQTMNGFSIGYINAFSISKTIPIFIETGLNLNYSFKSIDINDIYKDSGEDDYGYDDYYGDYDDYYGDYSDYYGDYSDEESEENDKVKYTKMSISIPVNVAYKFTLKNNSDISIVPFVGLNLKANIIGKIKYGDEDAVDQFDKDKVGEDSQWKRFQIGWNVGAGINYKALYAGLKYGTDFTELCKKVKTSNWAITVGYNF